MTPGSLRHALALLLCAFHISCDDGLPAESPYDSDWRLVEDLVLTGTADSVFFSISGIAVDSAHKVYVLDGFGRRVHVFDADGSHLQEVEKWIAALAKTQTKPMFYGFLSDGRGHTYVFPRTMSAPAGTAVDVFRHTGQYLGRMAFPERVDFGPGSFVGFATPEHIYVAAELSLQPAVLRFRIER